MLDRDMDESIPKGDGNIFPTLNTQSNQTRRKLLTFGGFISLALFAAGCISKTSSRHQNIPSRRQLLSDRSKETFYKQRDDLWKTNRDDFHEDGIVDLHENEDLSLGKNWKKDENVKGGKNAELGFSVTMSANGARLAVGCPGDGKTGSVQAFEYGRGQVGHTIKGNNKYEKTGHSVHMSDNSQWMVVGEPYAKTNGKESGRTRVYRFSGGSWKKIGNSIKGEKKYEKCGATVQISTNGQRVVVGCTGKKRSRIYDLKDDKWKQVGKDIKAGGTVSMTHDGKHVAVSDSKKNKVKIYRVKSSSWKQMGNTLSSNNGYGYAISVAKKTKGSNVVRLAVGKKSKKDVRTYQWDPSKEKWKEQGKVTSIKGQAVHLTPTHHLAVGDPTKNSKKGEVRIFEFKSKKWKQKGSTLKGSGSKTQLGFSVDIDDNGKFLFVGSPGKNSNKGEAQVYIYK